MSLAKNPLGVFGMREGMEIDLNGRSMGRENISRDSTNVNGVHVFPCSFEVAREIIRPPLPVLSRDELGKFCQKPYFRHDPAA